MRKLFFILTNLFFLGVLNSNAQCTVDYTQAQPGIYPATLPSGMVGSAYSESITFVMPQDTSGLDFTNFYIQSVSGLPFGLNWLCDSPGTNCNYNPQTSQHGCIGVSGTPLLAGAYPIDVSVVATLNLIGDVPVNFYTQVIIEPDTSSNAGFSVAGAYGCSPITVSFTNNNPGMSAYNWDFGNGTTSSQENPAPQIYTSPGEYVVNYEAYTTTTPSYFLTNIEVLDADGWSGDLDDGFGSLNPDPYIKVLDQSGTTIYTSPVYIDQNFPVSWSINNIPLQNQTYTIEVWDEDGFWTGDDFCGSHTFQGFSSSNTMVGGGEIISYTNSIIQPTPITSSDTVFVYQPPPTPNIDSLGLFLWTDSLGLALQWYQNGNPLPGATNDTLVVSVSGEYFVLSTTPEGCFSSSDTLFMVVCDSSFVPTITQNGNLLYTDTTSYSIQWYQDGVPITGATSQLLQNNNEGDFWVVLTSYDGCAYVSEVLTVDFTSIKEHSPQKTEIKVYPNPTTGSFFLKIQNTKKGKANLRVLDLSGRVVLKEEFIIQETPFLRMVSVEKRPGTYFVEVGIFNQKTQTRIIIK